MFSLCSGCRRADPAAVIAAKVALLDKVKTLHYDTDKVFLGQFTGNPSPSARLSLHWHRLAVNIETPTRGRGGCSRMTFSPLSHRRRRRPGATGQTPRAPPMWCQGWSTAPWWRRAGCAASQAPSRS